MQQSEARLWILAGPAGSGKSSVAPSLIRAARAMGISLAPVDPDVWFGPMERALLAAHGLAPDDRDSPQFKTIVRPLRYAGLWSGIEHMLDAGQDVLAIAPFTREVRDGSLWSLAAAKAWRHQIACVWLTASPDVRRARILARSRPEDAAKLADWDAYLASGHEPDGSDERVRVVFNDDSDPRVGAAAVLRAFGLDPNSASGFAAP